MSVGVIVGKEASMTDTDGGIKAARRQRGNGRRREEVVHRFVKILLRRPSTFGTLSCTYSRSSRCLLSFCCGGRG